MSLVTLILVVLLAGVVYWLIQKAPFIDAQFKQIALWLILACVVLYIVFGVFGPFPDVRIHR